MEYTNLFSLNIGDRFILNDKKYTITDFRQKRVPRLGKILHCVTLSEGEGKVQLFIRNWQVQRVVIEECDCGFEQAIGEKPK